MKPFGHIYLIINLLNHKMYGGKTTSLNVIKYIKDHFYHAYKNTDNGAKYLYNAVRKYGKKNFKYIILGECYSEDELNESEIAIIYHYRLYGSDGENYDAVYGYNMTKGGEGVSGLKKPCSYLTKSKISKTQTGKKRTPQMLLERSKLMKQKYKTGELVIWNKGKKMSELRKQIITPKRKALDYDLILSLYNDNLSIQEISKIIGCGSTTIYRRLLIVDANKRRQHRNKLMRKKKKGYVRRLS